MPRIGVRGDDRFSRPVGAIEAQRTTEGKPLKRPNRFAGGTLDRVPERRADAAWLAEQRRDPETRVVPVLDGRCPVSPGEPRRLGLYAPGSPVLADVDPDEWILLGTAADRALFAAPFGDNPSDRGLEAELSGLRDAAALLSQEEGAILAYAAAVVAWRDRTKFCGRCGGPTRPEHAGHIRRCSRDVCGASYFPRTDPAIIVLVTNGERCLLGRQAAWPKGIYSTIAGFVEPGESLREAVRREVREETGVDVGAVEYHSSQPWPFPTSIMLGFHASAIGGEPRPADAELEDARWFTRSELERRHDTGFPRLPNRVSISRRLISDWLEPV